MESVLLSIIAILSALFVNVGHGKAAAEPGRDGYYDEETPDNWVDYVFIALIAIHHFEYAFKFTDYSLAHIHIKQHKVNTDDGEEELADVDGTKLGKQATDRDRNQSVFEKMDVLEIFTTESDRKTQRRRMHNRLCCCIRFSPRFFTWNRTYLIRTFLKLYFCISCLLAMVLYVEFFMNLFVEYLITCIVHYDEGYVAALIMIPILLYVCDILVRLAWQAVVLSWSLNCDANGDLEAMDSQVGIAALRNQILSSKRLLYTFTNDARENFDLDDEYKSAVTEDTRSSSIFSNIARAISNSDDGKNKSKNDNISGPPSKTGHIELTANASAVSADFDSAGHQSRNSKLDSMLMDGDQHINPDQVVKNKKRRERERSIALMKKADKEAHRAKMGDYFMATCWRLGFFFYSMIFACVAAWNVEVEVAVNGFFWQLVMRYCVLGGVVWTMVYSASALFVAVASRFRSWYLIHEDIPRYKLFLLVDAHDLETSNQNWTRLKIIVMSMSAFTAVFTVILSYVFIDESWSSFVHFVGIIWALYYLANLFMSCKPYALVALWTDTIPPPGKNYKAHEIASSTLKKRGDLTVSLRSGRAIVPKKGDGGADGVDTTKGMAVIVENENGQEVYEEELEEALVDEMIDILNGVTDVEDNEEAEDDKDEPQKGTEETEEVNKTEETDKMDKKDENDIDENENNEENNDGKKDEEQADDEEQLGVVSDNLRSVKSTKRILTEKADKEYQKEEEEQKEDTDKDKGNDNEADQDKDENNDNEQEEEEEKSSEKEVNSKQPQYMKVDTDYGSDVPSSPTTDALSASNQSEADFMKLKSISDEANIDAPTGTMRTLEDVESNDEANINTVALKEQQKKSMKKQKTFRTKRAEALQRRYEAFKYEYEECVPEDYAGGVLCCNFYYQHDKTISFLHNYEQYWLNVYRPFDEYDIESNLSSTHILSGFQWMKGIVECKMCDKRGTARKKTCGQRAYRVFKYFMDNCCNICVIITMVLFMVGLFQTSQRVYGNYEAFEEKVIYETNQTDFYSVCSDGFGDLGRQDFSEYDLSVIDVIVLTQLAYEADNYDLCEVIDVYFNGTFKLVKIHREEPFYFHIRHKYADLDFIAIRGTDNLIEIMQDLSLFVEVGIFETLQWIVPFLNGLPTSMIRQVIYYASYIEGVINSDARAAFDEPVIEYVREYLRRLESPCPYSFNVSGVEDWNGPTTMYFVGHSLGGGISQIVAANLHEENARSKIKSHVQSFGVCSPGVLYSSAKFGFGVEALDKTSSSILPRRDIVSKVDDHGGSVQWTECDADSALSCHKTDNVLCEVFYGCPDDLLKGPKKEWLIDFCYASSGKNETLGKPQIGKSILRGGYNVTEITDWRKKDILEQCDDFVYDFCLETNEEFEICYESLENGNNKDICYSDAELFLD